MRTLDPIRRWLETPRARTTLGMLALVLVSPALFAGLALDDHVLALAARADRTIAGLPAEPWHPFRFTSGRPEDNWALMDAGALLPWWSDPAHRNAFFRPLSAATHLVDFALWPDSPWLMHLHSILWFAVLLGVVEHLYRRFAAPVEATHLAPLAFALFALDDAHGMTVGWIANRNALVAAALALPALGAHHRWVAQGWRPGRWLGPACFLLGLAAGESAVAVFGYLVAHALVLDTGPLARRALRLGPYLAILGAYLVLFAALGLGSEGSDAYRDPLRDPIGYLAALAYNAPVLLSAELALPLADLGFWGRQELRVALWVVSALTLVFVGVLARKLLRSDRVATFWALGMVLATAIVAASVIGERLLLVVGVGGAALLARLLSALASEHGRLRAASLVALGVLHLGVAPAGLPVRAYSVGVLAADVEDAGEAIAGGGAVPETAIVVNAPFDTLMSYVQLARAAERKPRPAHLHWLASASSEIELRVLDERSLEVRLAEGYLRTPLERHYRADPSALALGATVELTALTARVTDVTADGRPSAVAFELRHPLADPRYGWWCWRDGKLERFTLPAPGQTVRFPREDFQSIALGGALRRWGLR